ncbi:MAG: virulence factor TspB C-terminal domain-related protein [Methylococcus sp.]|nr:virulence factor TspB C-terminal domain-related protein [Methylococcus sp.]
MDHRVLRSWLLGCGLLAALFPGLASAAQKPALGSTIGSSHFYTAWPPGSAAADIALAALYGFRSAFSPFNVGMTIGTTLVAIGVADTLRATFFQPGANVLPPGVGGWTDGNTPPATTGMGAEYYDGRGWCSIVTGLGGVEAATLSCNQKNYPSVSDCVKRPGGWSDATGGFVDCKNCGGCNTAWSVRQKCPSGYKSVSGTCTYDPSGASGVAAWGSDSPSPYYEQQSGQWTPNPHSPDTDAGVTSTPYTRTGTDEFGNPVSETLSPTPDGGVDYTRQSQSEINGQPAVEVDKVHVSPNGVVTSVTSNIYYNTTINQSPTQNPTIDTSSLNKEATQQQILAKATSADATLTAIKDKLDCTSKNTLGCVELGEAGQKTALQTQDKANLFNEVSMGGAGACPYDLSVTAFGFAYVVSYDLVCQFASGIRYVVLAIAWVSAGWIIFGSLKGA